MRCVGRVLSRFDQRTAHFPQQRLRIASDLRSTLRVTSRHTSLAAVTTRDWEQRRCMIRHERSRPAPSTAADRLVLYDSQ
jgi:hypothetical protein